MTESYLSRTAGLSTQPKTIQAWKKNIVTSQNASHSPQAKIVQNLQQARESRTAGFEVTSQHAMSFRGEAARQPAQDTYQFSDVIDVVNPLHHLPVVGFVYRNLTGDDIHPASQIVGGALYGGPIGAAAGMANAVSKMKTGKDLGDHAMAMIGGNDKTMRNALAPQRPQENLDLIQHYEAPIERVNLDAMPEKTPITRLNLSV